MQLKNLDVMIQCFSYLLHTWLNQLGKAVDDLSRNVKEKNI
jgi:hypothetical protein